MATVLSVEEAAPEGYPAVTHWPRPEQLPDDPDPALDWPAAWRRIEAWVAWRWSPRAVTVIVEGPGEWTPRLRPWALSAVERWSDAEGWVAATAAPTPLGGLELDAGVWRIVGTAGADAGPVPADVLEAVRRLAEYHQGVAREWWANTASYAHDGAQKPAGWAAKALHLSGAADLLRPWRRLGA